ncbi:hypothetical protein Tco_0519388 [Tanacetum coccineum]
MCRVAGQQTYTMSDWDVEDLVHIVVNTLAAIVDYQKIEQSYVDEYNECLELKTELSRKNDMVDKAVYNELSKRHARTEIRSHLKAKDNSINKLKDHIATLEDKSVSEGDKSANISKVIAPGIYKLDLEPLSPMLLSNREAHVDYLKYTHEHADTFREIVKHAIDLRTLDSDLDYACKFATRVQELLVYVRDTCPSSIRQSEKLIAVTPINRVKKVRFAKPSTSSSNTHKHVYSCKTKDSSKPLLPSTGVISSTSASGSKPQANT